VVTPLVCVSKGRQLDADAGVLPRREHLRLTAAADERAAGVEGVQHDDVVPGGQLELGAGVAVEVAAHERRGRAPADVVTVAGSARVIDVDVDGARLRGEALHVDGERRTCSAAAAPEDGGGRQRED
jgi:hypothetical protein